MAQASERALASGGAPLLVGTRRRGWPLRLALGSVALAGTVLFLLGTSWDVHWHSTIGRDRTLIPPHLVMLGGIALCGVAALAAVAIESVWARRDPALAATSTPLADVFQSSLGAYVVGFGALDAAVGFPLDAYWHALYGIDVSIWAPFHIMIIAGMSLAAFGAAAMLLSGANLASRAGARAVARWGYVGALIGLATMLGALLLFLDAAFGRMQLTLFGLPLDVFPVMCGGFGAFPLAIAARAHPWRWAASAIAAVYYAFDLLLFLAIPPLTDALALAEQQSYRRGHGSIAVVSLIWPLSLIVGAVLIDLAARAAWRHRWSYRQARQRIIVAATVGFVLVPLLDPWFELVSFRNFVSDLGLSGVVIPVSFVTSLALGALGALVASWLGADIGESLRGTER